MIFEPLGPKKGREFLDQFTAYQLLKKLCSMELVKFVLQLQTQGQHRQAN